MRALFLTSNGTGLGHLTRAMAIARRLERLDASILTLSSAAPVAAEQGFHVEYFPSHDAAAAGAPRRWDRRLRSRIDLLLEELEPRLLVFDGAHPYDALAAVLRGAARRGIATVWCRRPLWREGFGAEGLYWSGSFDRVLEPGELAASEDRGLTVSQRDVARVGPIVYLDPGELLSREEAERELGLEPGRVNALVQLGQGPALDTAVERTLLRLAAEPGVQVAAVESSLSGELEIPEGVVHLRATYPMSRYHRAFDLAVAAAGYNAFHELLAAGVPSLFVPMPRNLDDQAARARWARTAGIGEGVSGPLDPDLEGRLEVLLDRERRAAIAGRAEQLGFRNGAHEAARIVEELALAERPGAGPGPGAAGAGGASRRDALAVSAQLVKRVGPRLPAIVARRALERFRNPPPPPAKLVCLALGLDGAALLERLHAAARERGLEPHRIVAITDSLDFAALRRAGFAFEHVPGEAAVSAVLEARGEPYARFRERRVEAAREGRAGAAFLDLSG